MPDQKQVEICEAMGVHPSFMTDKHHLLAAIEGKLQKKRLPHRYHYFPGAKGGWKHLWTIFIFSELRHRHIHYPGKGRTKLNAMISACKKAFCQKEVIDVQL